MVELVLIEEDVRGKDAGEGERMSRKYSATEVSEHNSAEDCWLIIQGKVYDVTKYLDDHPGGDQILIAAAGEDATDEFDEAGHSEDARKMMDKYLIGQVDEPSTSSISNSSSLFLYKTLPVVASVLVLSVVVGTVLWRRKRTA
ncbi:hypothetical protein R1flu_021900 [Riccia fluitans]|uniref:Cytochrome b5 heme-binding domain-containing protein n=1 Tax=Riccia fluitans TaxID=41844 RepID=A0ABD1ZRB4_9MARC